jgi:hypothetical protein
VPSRVLLLHSGVHRRLRRRGFLPGRVHCGIAVPSRLLLRSPRDDRAVPSRELLPAGDDSQDPLYFRQLLPRGVGGSDTVPGRRLLRDSRVPGPVFARVLLPGWMHGRQALPGRVLLSEP